MNSLSTEIHQESIPCIIATCYCEFVMPHINILNEKYSVYARPQRSSLSGVRTGGGGGGSGVKTPPIDDWKKLKTALFGPISLFSYKDCVFLSCIKLPI